MRTIGRLNRVNRIGVGASSPPALALSAGIAYNAGDLASGCLTLTGNATNGTGPYSYSWEIAGPTTVSAGIPGGWEWLDTIISFNGNRAGSWDGTNPSTNSGGGASPATLDMNVYGPILPDPYAVIHGGYYTLLTVTDSAASETTASLSLEVHDEGLTANYTRGGEISGGVTFDVTIVNEQTSGGNDGELIFSNITCPANATHWAMYEASADFGLAARVNESIETGFTLTGKSPQDYLFVTWAFGPGRNGTYTVHGPYTISPFVE